jgi:putative Mn2+ efflux pump MntP
MIGTVLMFGILAGLDNLQVCSSLGLLPIGRRHRLAAAFTICELTAPLAGLALGHTVLSILADATPKAGPVILLVCGGVVLYRALRHERSGADAEPPFLAWLPPSLGLDNLLAGAAISALPSPVPSAVLIGAVSAAMSCAGLYLGFCLRSFLPKRIELVAGVYLCALAVRMFVR